MAVMYKLIEKAQNIVFLNDELYYYNNRDNSITKTFSESKLIDRINIKNEMYSYIEKNYPTLHEINTMNRIKEIYRYYSFIGRFSNKFIENDKLKKEYEYYKNNYKCVKRKITQYNFLYNVLFYNRKLFYILIKICKKV